MFSTRLLVPAAAGLAAVAAMPALAAVSVDHSDRKIDSLTIDRGGVDYTYAGGELITADLTAFTATGNSQSGANTARVFGAVPAAGSRHTILGDLDLSTGFVNMVAWAVTMTAPVVNSDGADLILFDWGNSVNNPDSYTITINGVAQPFSHGAQGQAHPAFYTQALADHTFADGSSEFELAVYPPNPITNSSGSVSSLAALETDAFGGSTATSEAGIAAIEIDLSDFGVALGDSITVVQFTNGNGIDPMEVVGLVAVPEPASLALLGIGGTLAALRRRRGA